MTINNNNYCKFSLILYLRCIVVYKEWTMRIIRILACILMEKQGGCDI